MIATNHHSVCTMDIEGSGDPGLRGSSIPRVSVQDPEDQRIQSVQRATEGMGVQVKKAQTVQNQRMSTEI